MSKTKLAVTLFPIMTFSILNALLLIGRFTWLGMISTAIVIAFYFIRILYYGDDDYSEEKNGITHWLSTFLGTTAINFLAICLFDCRVFDEGIVLSEWVDASAVTLSIFLLIGGYILLLILCKKWDAGEDFMFYGKFIYITLLTLWVSCLLIDWKVKALLPILAIVAGIAMIGDHIDNKYNILNSNAGFVCCLVLFLAFNILCCISPFFAWEMVSFLYHFRLTAFVPEYVLVLALVLLAVCALNAYLIKVNKRQLNMDVHIYLSLVAFIAMLWILDEHSTKYDGIFLLILTALCLTFCLHAFKEKIRPFFGMNLSQVTLRFIGLLVLALLLPVSLYYGWAIGCGLLCVAAVAVFNFYEYYAAKQDVNGAKPIIPHQSWYFWQFLLTVVAVYAALTAYMNSRFDGAFVFILCVYALATVSFAFLSLKNKQQGRNHYVQRMVIALACMLCLLLTANQFNVPISIAVDDTLAEQNDVPAAAVNETGNILVTIGEEEGEPLEAYYYWTGLEESVAEAPGQITEYNPVPLTADGSEQSILPQQGCLHILCKDQNGVTASLYRWFDRDVVEDRSAVIKPDSILINPPPPETEMTDLLN